ncbi:MAG: GNAT family N-acetyltransferase [Pseudomonadota bacterium]
MRRRVALCFVANERDTATVHGYYTLSTASVLLDLLPEELASKMPRYPTVPAVRLGRLAAHRDVQGQGLGTFLLMDAMARSLRIEAGWAAFLVDALDATARDFYLRFGFESLDDDPNHLFLMRKTIEPLFRIRGRDGDGSGHFHFRLSTPGSDARCVQSAYSPTSAASAVSAASGRELWNLGMLR